MRQRNIKNLEQRLRENSTYLIDNPKSVKGKWGDIFESDYSDGADCDEKSDRGARSEDRDKTKGKPLFLEIGCGKGQFILKLAEQNPSCNYIAVEGQSNVMLRTMEKAESKGQKNLRLFIDYIHDLGDYFEIGELDGIYLNFSDPWPKARHDKRRLTYHKRLENYFRLLKPNGFVAFKTDNDKLFEFTLEEIELAGLRAVELTRDLHGASCEYDSKQVTTEYEDKFKSGGKNINYVKIKRGGSGLCQN